MATVLVDVPYKRAGNVIAQHPLNFDLYRNEDVYVLIPLLDERERTIVNLPNELRFVIEEGKPVSLRGIRDGNLHVIQGAIANLGVQAFDYFV